MGFSIFADFWKKKAFINVLFLILLLALGSPNFSFFNKLVKTSDRSSFDELELRLPDIALAEALGIPLCELELQNITQEDYKKAIKGLSFLQQELINNFKQDSLQSLIIKVLGNNYPVKKDNLCLPPLLISANATDVITGKEITLASQKLSCNGEAYLDNKFKVTDSLVNYSTYLKDNKVLNKLNKNINSLKLKAKSLTSKKQLNSINKNILKTTLARNTARFYIKHSDKLVTFYESLCLEDPEDPLATPTPSANCDGSNSQGCAITNGTGIETRTCNNGTWSNYGTCGVVSCNLGYQVSGNSCTEISNPSPTPATPSNRISPPTITSPTTSTVTVNFLGEVTVSWTAVYGAIGYLTRYQNITDGTPAVMNTNHTTTSLTFIPIIGKEYKFWVHAKAANFSYADPDSYSEQDTVYFTALTGATPTPSPPPATCSGSPTQACNITNGTGQQTRTCNSGTWSNFGTCTIQSCNSGYQVSGNSCVASVTSPFIKGDRVELINNTNFRKSPALSGVLIQQLPTGRVGTIVGDSAIKNNTDSFTWREVDFGLGQVSYAGEDNFRKHVTPTPSPVACQNGTTTTRTRYQNPSVPDGQTCVSQTQTGTCVNGEFTNWTGTYTNTNCYVEGVNHCASGSASAITQFGITWTFNKTYQCGQFANGDYWVVGPVTIADITPKDTTADGIDMHGTMINPPIGKRHGWDSRIRDNIYDPSLNVAKQLPNLLVPNHSSVVSAKSHLFNAIDTGNSGNNPQLETAAVLTVLPTVPTEEGSFRPSIIGTDKTIKWNQSQLNYGILKNLAHVPNTPPLKPSSMVPYNKAVENWFERPWIETEPSWTGRYIHPDLNYPNMDKGGAGTYSRESSHTVAQGMLLLQLNYSNADKEKLFIRLVQIGIDIHGAAKAGAVWYADGGHNIGRKMPLLLAGKALNSREILNYTDGLNSQIFQEDQQTFYVTTPDTVRTDGTIWFNGNTSRRGKLCEKKSSPYDRQYVGENCTVPLSPYMQADINAWKAKGFPGIPEWGVRNKNEPERNNADWGALYRGVASFPVIGHALTAKIMGLESDWNNPAFFDYYDRFYSISGGNVSTGTNSIQPFVSEMWKAYRNSY